VDRVTAWKYIGASDPTRLAALLSAVSFSHIAERLEREMNIVCCHKQDCNDSPGFARIIYCAEIGQMLFDLFFNSAFGTEEPILSHRKKDSRQTGSCFVRKSC
jgi:hypothetical protein